MMNAYFRQSLQIWFSTNLIGTILLWLIAERGSFPFYQLLAVAMLFSLPAILMLMPSLYILEFIASSTKRLAFAFTCTLTISSVVLALFLTQIPLTVDAEIGKMFLPYVVAAPVCFIVVVERAAVIKHRLNVKRRKTHPKEEVL